MLCCGLLTWPSFVSVSDGVTEMKLTREDKEGGMEWRLWSVIRSSLRECHYALTCNTRGGVRGVLPPLLLYRHLASTNQKAHEALSDDRKNVISIDG